MLQKGDRSQENTHAYLPYAAPWEIVYPVVCVMQRAKNMVLSSQVKC